MQAPGYKAAIQYSYRLTLSSSRDTKTGPGQDIEWNLTGIIQTKTHPELKRWIVRWWIFVLLSGLIV